MSETQTPRIVTTALNIDSHQRFHPSVKQIAERIPPFLWTQYLAYFTVVVIGLPMHYL